MQKEKITILAIESSCDDTAASVFRDKKILSNVLSTQGIHRQYGGVVPELASRDHEKNIVPVVHEAMQLAKTDLSDLDCIAYTRGPGLLGSLLVGCCFAKSMSQVLGKPLIGVNHMKAHILSNFIELDDQIEFPLVCLTVSGGHTQLVYVKDFLDMQLIGQTLDDAMGEAFDKIGKMMGLAYPSGPVIDDYAKKGNKSAFKFSDTVVPELDYSFSGIKTGFSQFFQREMAKNNEFFNIHKYDICASIQSVLISMAMRKLCAAVELKNVKSIAIAGGVAANSGLRIAVKDFGIAKGLRVYLPLKKYCTDNAAMIAITSYFMYLEGNFDDADSVVPMPRMRF